MAFSKEQLKEHFKPTFTLRGRMFYPNVLAARSKEAGKDPRFSALFAFKMDDPQNQQVLQQMQAFIQHTKQTFHPTVPDMYWANPLKIWGQHQRQDGKPIASFLEGCAWVNASQHKDIPPAVYEQTPMGLVKMEAGKDEDKVYSGRNVAVSISFWLIERADGKRGATTNFSAVLLLEGGEMVRGETVVDPTAIFGQFMQQMPQGNQFQQQHLQQNTQQAPAWGQQPQQNAPAWNATAPVQQMPPQQPDQNTQQAPAWGQAPQGNSAQTAQQGQTQSYPQNSGGYAPPASPSNQAPAWNATAPQQQPAQNTQQAPAWGQQPRQNAPAWNPNGNQ